MSQRTTKAALAHKLGISERHVHTVLRERTSSRALAEKIATYWGGEAEDYMRPLRRRGRQRAHIFREFIFASGEEEMNKEQYCVLMNFFWMYKGAQEPLPPDDFDDLESLLTFTRNARLNIEARDAAPLLWRRFRVWREYQLYLERVFEIECEDE
jgi:hypothetical protein